MKNWKISYKKYDGLYVEVFIESKEQPTRDEVHNIALKNNISYIECQLHELIVDVSISEQQEKEYHEKASQDKIKSFLKQLRETDETMIHIFTKGSCYKLCNILKFIYPNAKALYSKEEGHWITEIDGSYYDIGGQISKEYAIGKAYEYSPELEASADIPTYSNNVGVVYGKYI